MQLSIPVRFRRQAVGAGAVALVLIAGGVGLYVKNRSGAYDIALAQKTAVYGTLWDDQGNALDGTLTVAISGQSTVTVPVRAGSFTVGGIVVPEEATLAFTSSDGWGYSAAGANPVVELDPTQPLTLRGWQAVARTQTDAELSESVPPTVSGMAKAGTDAQQNILITVKVTQSGTPISLVTLHYRPYGTSIWYATPMSLLGAPGATATYEGSMLAANMKANDGNEAYVTVKDEAGKSGFLPQAGAFGPQDVWKL